jgi:prolipoprotein diacylglyceryl transferase
MAPVAGQTAASLLLSIPSPERGQLDLGPISLHAYGLTLLVAIAACVVLTGIRWTRRGGDWDLVLRVAVWGVAAGIVGARAYHVITSWDQVPDEWWGVFAVWQGGLGVWGGIGLGTIVGAIVVRRSGESVARFMDAVAPGLLLAQAIGRWGNWWNQELFGGPTDRPWGLEISPQNRPLEYADVETFHPVFLYESLYALVGVVLLLLLDRFVRIRPPALFALYVAYYSIGRFFLEFLRVDTAHEWGPLRLNAWVALVFFVGGLAFFVWLQFVRPGRRGRDEERRRAAEPPKGPTMAVPKGRVRGSR